MSKKVAAVDSLEDPIGMGDCPQSVGLSQHDDYVINPSVNSVQLGLSCDRCYSYSMQSATESEMCVVVAQLRTHPW